MAGIHVVAMMVRGPRMTFSEIQGNVLWVNIPCETYLDIDDEWANFTGKWSIQTEAGDVECFGDLVPSTLVDGMMYARITAAQTRALSVQDYSLTFQIYNIDKDYEEEAQHTLTITKSERIV